MFNFKGSTPTKKQLLLEIKDFRAKELKLKIQKMQLNLKLEDENNNRTIQELC